MGSVVSSAANGVGTLVGTALAAPLKALFGVSCEGVCSGTWDLPCFLDHLCISSLASSTRTLTRPTHAVLGVARLLCKLGILKLAAKVVGDVAWRPCEACCRALGGGCCLLWRKVRGTRRVYRGRRRRQRDVETGEASTSRGDRGSSWYSYDDDGECDVEAGRSWRKPSSPSVRERRKDRIRRSLRLKRRVSSKVERAVRASYGGGSDGQRRRHSTGPWRTDVSPWSSPSACMRRRRLAVRMCTPPHVKVEPPQFTCTYGRT
ncbi:hypothetical protein BS78_02G091400 [Paspalum vaginatum]|nr:hypothetical protein BS78_02G091400 [Paspalum vaginatum]